MQQPSSFFKQTKRIECIPCVDAERPSVSTAGVPLPRTVAEVDVSFWNGRAVMPDLLRFPGRPRHDPRVAGRRLVGPVLTITPANGHERSLYGTTYPLETELIWPFFVTDLEWIVARCPTKHWIFGSVEEVRIAACDISVDVIQLPKYPTTAIERLPVRGQRSSSPALQARPPLTR